MVIFYVATSLLWACTYVYHPILAVYAENLGASATLVGTIVGAYGFGQLVLRIPLGIWSDRVGVRKPFMVAGFVAAAIAGAGLALTSDPLWLVVWRALSGACSAAWVVFTVLFFSYFAPEKVTSAMSRLAFVSSASPMAASWAGGLIAQQWGWRAPFFVAIGLALVGIPLVLLLHERPLPVRRDLTPAGLFRVGTAPLLLLVAGITMVTNWCQWATANGFSLVHAARLGANRADLGLLTTLVQMGGALAAPVTALLVGRIGIRLTVILGLVLQAVGTLMVPAANSLTVVAVAQFLVGAGRGLGYPILMGLSVRYVAPSDRATAMGVFQAVYAMGMFAGPVSTGLLGDAVGLSNSFLVASLVTLLAVPVVATRLKENR